MKSKRRLGKRARARVRGAAFGAALAAFLLAALPATHAQGSRKDDIVFGPGGHPVSGATVRVCQATATGTPCTPLATIYTDATLGVAAANPFLSDGIGNYHFYAPAGRYQIQISSPQISGTITQADVILAPDFSANATVAAFGLNLGGNLSVAGNANVSGTLTASNFNPGMLTPTTLNVTGSSTVAGPRPYIDVTAPVFGATADGGAEQATGAITSGTNQLTIAGGGTGTWRTGMGIHVDGAGASGDVLLAYINAISGSVFTLDRNAGASVSGANVQDDDTLAIQGALNTYCTGRTNANGGTLYFPPGNYIVSQNQSVNPNATPFLIGCDGLHLLGGNNGVHNGTPFVQPPTVSILDHCGPSPNAQPLFGTYYPHGNMTFQNLVITGCNIAVGVTSNVTRFWNTYLSASGGQTNGSALWVQDTFWVYFDYGGLSTGASVPTMLMTGASCGGCFVGVGDIYMTNTLLAGGPITYVQQGAITGSPSGHWVFRNITQESGNTDLIQITDPGSYNTGTMGPITLDDVQQADVTSTTAALINVSIPAGNTLSGVYINNSISGGGGSNAPAIKLTSGKLDHYFVTGCNNGCVSQVWDASGNPAGNGITESTGGLDVAVDTTNAERLNTLSNDSTGPGGRFFQTGKRFASYGIDAANGFMFGSNTQAGWNAEFQQSTAPNIDIAFAANSFTRANASSLGANWALNFSGSQMQILGNAAVAAASNYSEASYVGQVFNADQWSRAKIASVDSAGGVGVMARMGGANVDTGYLYFCSTSQNRNLSKRVAGVSTTLATAGSTCAANDVLELDMVGTTIYAIYNGTVDLTVTDSTLTSGAPGIEIWNGGTASADSLVNWYGGSLTVGNATTSIFNQPNTWVQPQTFASPINSASLAVPNKTRTCSILRGDQSGSALTTGNIQPQGSLCYVDAASTVGLVIAMVDGGASTVQVGYRHNGSTTTITSTLTPASVSGITDHVACANTGGTAITIEGNSVTCSALTHSALAAGDFIETVGGAADGTSKRLSIAMTFTPN